MIIKFTNLGTIRKTELDLRPLTIIIGPNNSNKTYIAYSIYALCQKNRWGSPPFFEQAGLRRENNYLWALPINDKLIHWLQNYFKTIIWLDLDDFFQDSSHKLFVKTELNFYISCKEVKNVLNKDNH